MDPIIDLSSVSPAAAIIISISLMLFCGFLMTRLTKLLRLPNVTAYIFTGIILGPFCLNLVPNTIIQGMDFLSDIALAFIAFSTGEFFRIDVLKKNGSKVIIITLLESLLASVLVFILTFVILKINLTFSIILASLAAATAPASTMMTIRQTNAKGDFVNTLLQVVALDDIVGLVLFSIALSIAKSDTTNGFVAWYVIKTILLNLVTILLGGIFGFLMKLLMPQKRSKDNKLIISIATLFLFCGVCALLDISPLLGCMAMGMVYINTTSDEKLFRQLGYFSPPILLLFFVRSGLNFNLGSLTSQSGLVGGVPLIIIGVSYFFIRIIGKYLGAFIGGLVTKKGKEVRNYLGLALIPQAGVAIGLAALAARTLGGDAGDNLNTIILASSVLYELIGPACAKLSLYLSKSYSNKIEEIVPIENENKKTELDALIERINKIQEELPKHEVNPEEEAFTEDAIAYSQSDYPTQRQGIWRRKR